MFVYLPYIANTLYEQCSSDNMILSLSLQWQVSFILVKRFNKTVFLNLPNGGGSNSACVGGGVRTDQKKRLSLGLLCKDTRAVRMFMTGI